MRRPLRTRVAIAISVGATALVACDDVQVLSPDVGAVELYATGTTIQIDERLNLDVVIKDMNGDVLSGQPVIWSSSNAAIAAVDNQGTVTGAGVGTTWVSARAGQVTDSIRITVENLPGFELARTSVSLTAVQGVRAGPEAVLISAATDQPATGLTGRAVYPQEGSAWLVHGFSSTTTPSSLSIVAQTQGLSPGVHQADLIVEADQVQPQVIRVTLTVLDPPSITLSNYAVSLQATQGSPNPVTSVIDISNTGTGSLTGLQATVFYGTNQPGNWLTAVLSSTAAPSQLTLFASASSLVAGTYNATVQVSGPGAANSPQLVQVTFVVGS